MMRFCFVLLLCAVACAERGQFQGCSYCAVRVDPHSQQLDLYTSGRTESGWSADYISLAQLPKDCRLALNGTFFSLRWHEPAGPLIYGQGKKRWTPRFS